jgi:hypothetical protein
LGEPGHGLEAQSGDEAFEFIQRSVVLGICHAGKDDAHEDGFG